VPRDAPVFFSRLVCHVHRLGILLPLAVALGASACGPAAVPVSPSPSRPPAVTPYTRYLAFGDSLTAGVVSLLNLELQWLPEVSYPSQLTSLLAKAYPGSPPTVVNAGKLGEWAADGKFRLPAVLATHRPQVVLLMQGSNDINALGDAGIAPTLSAIGAMVDAVQAAGATAVVATLPPETPGGYRADGAEIIPTFNLQLRALAERRRLILADVFEDLNGNSSMIGPDGLHLTARGYIRVAQTFLTASYRLPDAAPLAMLEEPRVIDLGR
jgi:lysophospholipase L1-like esterase